MFTTCKASDFFGRIGVVLLASHIATAAQADISANLGANRPGQRADTFAPTGPLQPVIVAMPNPQAPPDTDGDGVPDSSDAFPLDPNESADFDNDGLGNVADPDDDNDGVVDELDFRPLNAARTVPIAALYPNVNGTVDFPDHAAGNQLEWIMAQWNVAETSLAQIEARFVPGFDFPGLQSFFDVLRGAYPNAQVVEVLFITPKRAIIVIGDPQNPDSIGGVVDVQIRFSDGRINFFQVQNFPQNPSSTGAVDQSLSALEVNTKIKTLASDTSLLVARIDESNQCVRLMGHDEDVPRATGSLFKAWVLGAMAQGTVDGIVTPQQIVPLDPNEIVPVGEALSSEAPGTPFSMRDLAIMMMGTSDNTATDHLHELIGRDRAEATLSQFDHRNASRMLPFLSINETFHLYWTVPEMDALAYAAGTDSQQRDYLNSVLEPLGPVTAFPQANASILVDGTWQASPMDVCRAIAKMRQFPDTGAAFDLIDQAFGSNEGVWAARRNWDRVWFKGGSLADPQGLTVLTLGWLLESDERGAYVVVGMANHDYTSSVRINDAAFVSVMSRLLDLVNQSF